MRKVGLAALFVLVFVLAPGFASVRPSAAQVPSQGPEVWFAPFPYGFPAAPFQEGYGSYDAQQAFESAMGWDQASARVDVVKFYPGWVQYVTPQQLRAAVQGLQARGIAIAVEFPALRYDGVCGAGVEGFVPDPQGLALDILGRIQAAGGTVKYAALGEPFTFASGLYKGPQACNWPVERIAREVATFVDAIKRRYPGIIVGDIENDHPSPQDLIGWMDAYRQASGENFAFFHLDPDWASRSDWPQRGKVVELAARARGIEFGMLYYGSEGANNGLEFLASALDHIARYQGEVGGITDDLVFQSWHRYPRYVLPETEPGTYSWLIRTWAQGGPSLSLAVPGSNGGGTKTATATLRDQGGTPLAGKSVIFRATRLDGPGETVPVVYNGTVPAGATGAIVGYRVNTECNCAPVETSLRLEGVSYSEGGGPNRVPNGDFSRGGAEWSGWGATEFGDSAAQAEASIAEEAGLNSRAFPVTPGARFTLQFDARLSPRSLGGGYFVIIYLTDTEVGRTKVPFEPPSLSVTAVTNGSGVASATFPSLPEARWRFTAEYRPLLEEWPAYARAVEFVPGVPAIASLSLTSLDSTSTPTTLVVTGSGFYFDTVVRVDGVARPTVVVSPTELRVTLDPADTWRPGRRNVTAWTPPAGGGLSNVASYDVRAVPGRTTRTLPGVANDTASPPPPSALTGP